MIIELRIGSQPALEKVQRSVRNVDASIRDRQQTVDDLARRIGSLRLFTPDRSREGSAAAQPAIKHLPSSSGMPLKTTLPMSADVPDDLVAEVEAALDFEFFHRKDLLRGLKTARVTHGKKKDNATALFAYASFSSDQITADAIPLPGPLFGTVLDLDSKSNHQSISTPQNSLQSSLSAPTASAETAFAFGAIKLSLDPGTVASVPNSRNPRSSIHRTHTPAAKLGSSPLSSSLATGNITWESPTTKSSIPASEPSVPASEPSNFFR